MRVILAVMLAAMAVPAAAQEADVPANTNTQATMTVGEVREGVIEDGTDSDWFRIELRRGNGYTMSAVNDEGEPSCALFALRNALGQPFIVPPACEGDGFIAAEGGTYYVAMGSGDGSPDVDPERYRVVVNEDCVNSVETQCHARLGRRVDGTFGYERDSDWRRIWLVKGRTYVIRKLDLFGDLKLMNKGGREIASLPLWPGQRTTGELRWRATYSGIHYLNAEWRLEYGYEGTFRYSYAIR